MNLKITYPLHCENHVFVRITMGVMLIHFISYGIWTLDDQLELCHRSIFSLTRSEISQNSSFLQCRMPYYECCCSATLNEFSNSTHCITNIQAASGHILPTLSYTLQIYIIWKLFLLEGSYVHFFKGLFWVIALVVFVFIATMTRVHSCLYFPVAFKICVSGTLLFGFVVFLFIRSDMKYRLCQHDITDKIPKSPKKTHNLQVVIIWFSHHLLVLCHFAPFYIVQSL